MMANRQCPTRIAAWGLAVVIAGCVEEARSAPPAYRPTPDTDAWTRRLAAANVPDRAVLDHDIFRQFRGWVESFRADPKSVSVTEGVDLARRRRQSLKELIKLDPDAAWAQFLDVRAREGLPAGVADLLADSVSGTGDWTRYAICFDDLPFDAYTEVRLDARENGPSTLFGFAVGNLRHTGTETGMSLRGYVIDEVGAFDGESPRTSPPGDSLPVRNADDGVWVQSRLDPVGASPARLPDSLPLSGVAGGYSRGGTSLGYRTLLYMRIAFADNTNYLVQSEADAGVMLQAVNDHLIESSYGRMQVLATVTPVLVLPRSQSTYAVFNLGEDARAVAASLGYSPSQYGHRVYRYDGTPGSFGGLTVIGSNPADIWLRNNSPHSLAHEMGHNFGLSHSTGWITDDKAAIGPSTIPPLDDSPKYTRFEYGHIFDIMGNNVDFTRAQFCSYQKHRLGWLKESEWIDNTVNQVVRIHPLDQGHVDPDRRYAVRIPTALRGNYWLEFRRNYTTNPVQSGLLLQGQGVGWGVTDKPSRIDVTYWSAGDREDSCIPMGWTFSDYENAIHITPIAWGDAQEWIDVQIFRGLAVSNRAPSLLLSASPTGVVEGAEISFTADAVDPDGDPLAYHWYFDDEDWHRNRNGPHQTFAWDGAGVRSVICTVSDMRGGVAVRSIPVTVGIPDTYTISGMTRDQNGHGVAGASVHNGIDKNAARYRSTLTDDRGEYLMTRLPFGGYHLYCSKDYDEYDADFTGLIIAGPSQTGFNFVARTLRVRSSVAQLAERGGTAQIRIERVGSWAEALPNLRVGFWGSAENGTDYRLSPEPRAGTYAFPVGVDACTVTVTGLDDDAVEGPEDIIFTLRMTDGLSVIGPETAIRLTVVDDEAPLPRVELLAIDQHFSENGGTAGLLVRRHGHTRIPLAVNLNTLSGVGVADFESDYTFDTGGPTVTIHSGQEEAQLTVIARQDAEVEGSETVHIELADGPYIRADSDEIRIILADDDIPVLNLFAQDAYAGEDPVDMGWVRVIRTPACAAPLDFEFRVRGTAYHGTDYQQLAGSGTLPAGAAYVDIPITPLADGIDEDVESATLSLTSDDSDYTIGPGAEATVYLVGVADSDTDGLADLWEQRYFPALTNAWFGSDWDGDGMSEGVEFLTGTSPTDAASRLCVTSLQVNGAENTVVLRWASESNMFYSLVSTTNLVEGPGTIVERHIPATPPENAYTDTVDGAAARHYGVSVEIPSR